jgi:integrase
MSQTRFRQLGEFWLSQRPGRPHYYITWFDRHSGQTRRKTTGTGDLAEAERRLAEHFQLSERLDLERPSDVPLMTILDRYYHEHASKLPSKASTQYAIALLRQHCGEMTVADFRKKEQQRFADAMRQKGNSEGYISRTLSVARAALRRAYDNEEIAAIPPFIKLARGDPRDRVLSLTESAALFNAANGDAQFLYLLLAFGTCARPSAILDLTKEQIDFDRSLIRLNPPKRRQTKKWRPVIPMVETLRPWLAAAPAGPIIRHRRGRYTKWGWDAIFKRIVKRAGLADVSPYVIRHTIATEMAQRGVPQLEIEMFMGHNLASKNITGHYIHVRPEFLKSAVKALGEYFEALAPLLTRPISRLELEEQPTVVEWAGAAILVKLGRAPGLEAEEGSAES